jgi:hypothetical protein
VTTLTKRIPTNWSVSQVDLFLDCARKHYFKHVLRLPDPSNEAAARGVSIHKASENTSARLAQGAPLADALSAHDTADAPWMPYVRALAGAGILPRPGEPHAREHRFSLPTHTGIPLIGVIDLILDERTPIDLTDLKSVSDIRYAKTPIELLTNLQLNVYAHYIFENAPEHDVVRARLAYVEAKKKPLKTKLPRVVNVHVDLERENVRRLWLGYVPFGDQTKDHRLPLVLGEMLRTATECDDFNDVPPTTTTCTKYGGCPYRTQCGLSPFAGVASARNHEPLKRMTIEESKTMGFLSKNAPTNGGSGTPSSVAKPQTAPAAAAPPAAPKPTGFLARAKAAGAIPTEADRQAKLDQDFGKATVPTGVVPPDAPPRMTARASELPQNDVQASEATEEPTEAPKKRGRPRKVVQTDEGAGDGGEVDSAPVPWKATGTAKGSFFGPTIFVDCLPVKGGEDVTTLEDWWGPLAMDLNAWAQEEKKVSDYRLLDFSSEKAAISLAVADKIAKSGLPPTLLVSSSSGISRDVLPLILPHARTVIRALRG